MALQHSISIADAKAGYILAGSIAFLTFSIREALTEKTVTSPMVVTVVAGFVVSAILAAETFRPRLTKAPERSLSYWKSKIYEGDAETIVAEIIDDGFSERVDDLAARHLHALAGVCRAKYLTLNWAFSILLLAILAFVYWRVTS